MPPSGHMSLRWGWEPLTIPFWALVTSQMGVELSGGRAQVSGPRGWRSLEPSPSLSTSFCLRKSTTAAQLSLRPLPFSSTLNHLREVDFWNQSQEGKVFCRHLLFLACHTPLSTKVNKSLLPARGGGRRKYGGKSHISMTKDYPTLRSSMIEQCHKNWMLDMKSVGGRHIDADRVWTSYGLQNLFIFTCLC